MGKFGQQFDLQNPNKNQKSNAKRKKNPIKVTYISTPMKVKVNNASEFRAIVQELTGKDSDVGGYNSDDSFSTVVPDLPEDDAAKHVNGNREVDDQHTRINANTTSDDAYNCSGTDHAFASHLSLFDQFDERLLWRDFSAEISSSFGFQSPCVSLYD